jgi:hypothetical protein
MKKHTVIAVLGAAVLGAAGAAAGTYLYFENTQETQETQVASAAPSTPAPPPAPPMGPALTPGAYNFNITGGSVLPVTLDACGPDCFVLVAPPSQANPAGFRQEMRLTGTRYAGQSHSEKAVVCTSDHQPRAAESRYSLNLDGTHGLVEVLGQPCGPWAPNAPLAFSLTPAPPA